MIEIISKIHIIMLTSFTTFFDFKSIGGFLHFLGVTCIKRVFFKNVAHIFPVPGDNNYNILLNFFGKFPNDDP